ncbi:unnamed protein product, partial [Owenia fusiformis]
MEQGERTIEQVEDFSAQDAIPMVPANGSITQNVNPMEPNQGSSLQVASPMEQDVNAVALNVSPRKITPYYRKRSKKTGDGNGHDNNASPKKSKIDPPDPYKVIQVHMRRNHAPYISAFLSIYPGVDFGSQEGRDCVFEAIDDNNCEMLKLFLKHSPS